ncbi:MAG TPA: response regulator [Balneolaceae bacterium]
MLSISYLKNIVLGKNNTHRKAEKRNKELVGEAQRLRNELRQTKAELDKKTRALKKSEQRVEKELKSKTEFLSSMSHEVRTPMNAIVGMTNLLVKGQPRSDQFEQLEILDFSAKTLLALINDMLDFTRIETGSIKFEKVAFNLNHLLESVLDSFLFTADKHNVRLYVNLDEDIPETIIGDPNRLTQILNNLVSNAIQFTENGSVGITAEKLEAKGNQLKLLIAVKDTGTGLSKNQGELFDVFAPEDTDTSQPFRGTGFGLTISQKLIEFQGGDIYVESEKGKGTTFFIEMAFELQTDKNIDTSLNRHITPRTLEGSTVLVVEDNIINQKVLARFLAKWKVRVIIAENGKQALDEIKSNLVSLVLMDLQMPEVDGYEATRLIRALNDTQKSNIPIIALTAAALQEVKERVLSTGMDDYLTKPFDPDELKKKLQYYILNKK